ncbi:MAG TPA: hypothetical protein VE197_12995, partial [Mycobacterium sp.]|nr:hypothetical protein [Mycobacterium sp.]
LDAVIAEEQRVFCLVDERDNRSRLDVRAEDPRRSLGERRRSAAQVSGAMPRPKAGADGRAVQCWRIAVPETQSLIF